MGDKDISLRIKELIDYFCDGNNSTFARAIGTSEANVRNYLNGRQPKFETLYLIADKFETSCDWLIKGEGFMLQEKQDSETSLQLSGAPHAVALEETMPYKKIDSQTERSARSKNDAIEQIVTLKNGIINTLKEQTRILEEQSKNYKIDCDVLRRDNTDLRTDVRELRKDNIGLRKEINRLRKEQKKLPLDFIREGKADLKKR